jgi:NADPH2:quinone reductase
MVTSPADHQKMQALEIQEFSGLSGIRMGERAIPEVGPHDVLIGIRYFGLSYSDLLLASGRYQKSPSLPFPLGSDFAGDVVSVGSSVTQFTIGQRVAGLEFGGAAAQFVSLHENFVFALPDSVSYEIGAGLPVNYLSAHFALKLRGGVQPGETVLVHGAAGGVGTAAIQLAKAWDVHTIGVVSTETKARFARAAGAEHTVLLQGFKESVLEITDGRGVDVVIDVAGGDTLLNSLRIIAPLGRLMVMGFTSAQEAIPSVKVNRLMFKNIDVRGSSWGPYSELHPNFASQQWADISSLLDSGALQPKGTTVYPVARAVDALREIEERRLLGKAVVEWNDN